MWTTIAAGTVIATASIAATAAGPFATSLPQPVPAVAGGEWQSLSITSIAQGSWTGTQAPAQTNVEPLSAPPQRRTQLLPVAATATDQPITTAHELAEFGQRRFMGQVGSDLYASLRNAGVPDSVSADYVQAIASRLDLSRGLGIADRFDLVIDRSSGGYRLLFAGLDRVGAADVMLMRWGVAGKLDWVDASGVGSDSGGMSWPVAPRVSSSYGMRQHPLLGFMRFHRGVDLRAAWGAPIRAAADGRVTGAGWAGGYGRQVRISHSGGLATTYSHMSRISAAPGQTVRRGQLIGYVGSSGLSTGPHLHYEVFKDGRPVNPASVRFARSSDRIDQAERQAMRARLRQLLLLKPVEA